MNFQNGSGTGVNFYEKPEPVSSEISDFTPCANAQSDILPIKNAALRKLMTRAQDLMFRLRKKILCRELCGNYIAHCLFV